MASFIAKQMVGDQLKSVKGALGDKEDDETKTEGGEEGEDPEITAARLELEEKRKEKHRKMEEEREEMRQSIRDKYGLKKKVKEEEEPLADPGRVGRKKKTPAELAAEQNAEEEDEDEFAKFPSNLSELTSKVSEMPAKLAQGVSDVTQKCVLQ